MDDLRADDAIAATHDGGDDVSARGPDVGRRPRRVRRVALVVGGSVLAAALAAGATWTFLPHDAPRTTPTGPAPKTVAAERKDVARVVTARGSVTFEASGTISTPLAGTVTSAPSGGAELRPGATLLRIDDRPVTILRGALPAWRAFAPGMADGADVRQLEQALRDAGYGPGWIDDHFTDVTESAVKRWQKDIGADPTGTVPLGAVVFLPADARVGSSKVAAGDLIAAGDDVATLAQLHRVVEASVPTSGSAGVAVGQSATVALSDGKSVPGKIASVGAAPPGGSDDDGERADEGAAKSTRVVVTLEDAAAVDGVADGTDVRVDITTPGITDSVVVPVSAVMATGGERYGVQVLRSGVVRDRKVELGTVADGFVAITGGLSAGERVVVPE